MANLVDAGNIWNHALDCLVQQGYEIRTEFIDEDRVNQVDQELIWYASKIDSGKKIELSAHDPPALLGLSVIWSRWGHDWRDAEVEDWWDKILSQ